MTAVELLLSRLESVRQRGPTQWSARCPAHEDRTPSLSIKSSEDRVLLHCWSGCSALEIVLAVGLELRDLFDHTGGDKSFSPARTDPFRTDALRHLRHVATVLLLAAGDLRHGKPLGDADALTVSKSFDQLSNLVDQLERFER